MASMAGVFDQMNKSGRQFDLLKEKFSLFANGIYRLTREASCPVDGAVGQELKPGCNSFDLNFLGYCWVFSMSFKMTNTGSPEGVISLYIDDLESSKRTKTAATPVIFDHHGVTGITNSDDNGMNASMTDRHDALFIAMLMIREALNQDIKPQII